MRKLFVNADPGAILTGSQREFCRSRPSQTEIPVPGIHFIQEDSGDQIGAGTPWLGAWAGRREQQQMGTAAVVVFDVDETLSDLDPMGRRFADVGAPEWAAKVYFASVLRDGFALTAAGSRERLCVIAEGSLRDVLAGTAPALDAAVEHVMSGFLELPPHPDVPGHFERLLSVDDAGVWKPPAPTAMQRASARSIRPPGCSSRSTPGTSTVHDGPG